MDLIFLLIAMGVALSVSIGGDASGKQPAADAVVAAPLPPQPEPEPEPAPILENEPASGEDSAQASPGFTAEDQTPGGTFTTAGEVRPILDATKGSWIALRDYGGQDLLYFTQLLSWRCGLHQIAFAINDDAPQVLTTEPCYADTAQPNAIRAEVIQPYLAFPAGSVQSVTVSLLYNDLGEATAQFERSQILMP